MAIRKLKPDTPSRRYMSVSTFEEITKSTPERKLTTALRKTGGRNNHGRITSRRRGGGHRRRYRIIDFKRNKFDFSGIMNPLNMILIDRPVSPWLIMTMEKKGILLLLMELKLVIKLFHQWKIKFPLKLVMQCH